jgi:hypothetical protein
MSGSLSVASTASLSAKVAMIDSGVVGRTAIYSRYNKGPRTLPWGMPALTGEFFVLSLNLYDEVSAMQI